MTPTVMVPRFGALEELPIGRVRYLIARNGVFIEARSRAAHARLLVAPVAGLLPYGDVAPFWRPAGGELPRVRLSASFIAIAREASPREAAALVLWKDGEYRLHVPTAQESSSGRVRYSMAGIDPQDVVVDMHSHGRMSAFFSHQDDVDDAANPSLCFTSMVVGNLDEIAISSETRVIANGWAASDLDSEAYQLSFTTAEQKPADPMGSYP